MRILQVSDGYKRIDDTGNNPIEAVIFEVSKNLVALGHDVTILERKLFGMQDLVEYYGIKVVRLDKRRADVSSLFNLNSPAALPMVVADGLAFSFNVRRFVIKEGNSFDIINFHLPLSGLAFSYFAQNLKAKTVYTYHGSALRLGLSVHKRLPFVFKIVQPDLFLMKRVSKVVVLNQELREKIVCSCHLEPSKFEVINNAVNVKMLHSNLDQGLDLEVLGSSGKMVVLFVGIVMPIKGVENIVKAANILINTKGYHNLLFIIAGSLDRNKEYVKNVKQLVIEYKLVDYVKFTGHINHAELGKLYSDCDIFVLPSLDEGFGIVVAEAMSFSKPVVGTRVGGIPMQIIDGWNGFLVDPESTSQLAEKIQYLLINENERLRLGKNGKELLQKRFNWETVAKSYENLYQSIISQRK